MRGTRNHRNRCDCGRAHQHPHGQHRASIRPRSMAPQSCPPYAWASRSPIRATVAENPATRALIAEPAAPLKEIRQRVVAAPAESIARSRDHCRAIECQMGNLVADAMPARVADHGIRMTIPNGEGRRASIVPWQVKMDRPAFPKYPLDQRINPACRARKRR